MCALPHANALVLEAADERGRNRVAFTALGDGRLEIRLDHWRGTSHGWQTTVLTPHGLEQFVGFLDERGLLAALPAEGDGGTEPLPAGLPAEPLTRFQRFKRWCSEPFP